MSKYFPGLSVGRIVNYVLAEGVIRPAIVVRVWDGVSEELMRSGYCNIRVFLDGENDDKYLTSHDYLNTYIIWRTSVVFDEDKKVGTVHWPVRE